MNNIIWYYFDCFSNDCDKTQNLTQKYKNKYVDIDNMFIQKIIKLNDDPIFFHFAINYKSIIKKHACTTIIYDKIKNKFEIKESNIKNRIKIEIISISDDNNNEYHNDQYCKFNNFNIPDFINVKLNDPNTFFNNSTRWFISEIKFLEYENKYKNEIKLVENLIIENINNCIDINKLFRYIVSSYPYDDDFDIKNISTNEYFSKLHKIMITNNYASAILKLKNMSKIKDGKFKLEFEILQVKNQLECKTNIPEYFENVKIIKKINNFNNKDSPKFMVGENLCFVFNINTFRGIDNLLCSDWLVEHDINLNAEIINYMQYEEEYQKNLINWVNDFFHI